jgi:hypothetical protein
MMNETDLAPLRAVYPDAEPMTEAGQEFVHLPRLVIESGGTTYTREAILSLKAHSGYTSRLLLSEPISGRGQNWSVQNVIGRNWHTPSWNNVAPGLPLDMLLQHLRVYR